MKNSKDAIWDLTSDLPSILKQIMEEIKLITWLQSQWQLT